MGKRIIVDLAICREISTYTSMHVLEANKARRGRQGERVWLGGGARGLPCRGGGVCEYEIDEKRGESVHLRGTYWT